MKYFVVLKETFTGGRTLKPGEHVCCEGDAYDGWIHFGHMKAVTKEEFEKATQPAPAPTPDPEKPPVE